MKKKLAIIGLSVLTLAALLAFFFYYWMGEPLHTPGTVRGGEGIDAPLEPPVQAALGKEFLEVTPKTKLYYFMEGEGPTALVIHGGPGFPMHDPWAGLRLLTNHYRFLYYHQRGCGKSTRPIQTFANGNYYDNVRRLHRTLGLGAQIADIERIRRILKQDRIVLVGHSFGAFLAALYAAEFPQRVQALVLVAPANLVVMPQEDGGLFEQVRQRLPDAMRVRYEDFLSRYFDFGSIFSKNEQELAALNREFVQYYRAATKTLGRDVSANGMSNRVKDDNGGWVVQAAYFSMGKRHDYSEALAVVKAPVLVVHGAKDLQSDADSRKYLEYFPHGEYMSIKGAGHFVYEDKPKEFSALVKAFLDKSIK